MASHFVPANGVYDDYCGHVQCRNLANVVWHHQGLAVLLCKKHWSALADSEHERVPATHEPAEGS